MWSSLGAEAAAFGFLLAAGASFLASESGFLAALSSSFGAAYAAGSALASGLGSSCDFREARARPLVFNVPLPAQPQYSAHSVVHRSLLWN